MIVISSIANMHTLIWRRSRDARRDIRQASTGRGILWRTSGTTLTGNVTVVKIVLDDKW